MNVRLTELRAAERKISYDTTVMSKLIQTQNKIIYEELRSKLGLNLQSLAPKLNLERELKKRADAAYLAVKVRVDMAKRSEAHKAAAVAAAAAAANGVAGSQHANERDAKPEVTPTTTKSPATSHAMQHVPLFVRAKML